MIQRVKDVMSSNIVAVLPSDTTIEAAKLMKEHNIGSIPVVSAGEVKGIVTDRDIVLRCIADEKKADKVKVSEIMSKDIAYITPDHSIKDAIEMMSAEQVRRLPVISGGYIDGMVSLADIARHNRGMEVAEAISEISEPNIGPSNAVRTH